MTSYTISATGCADGGLKAPFSEMGLFEGVISGDGNPHRLSPPARLKSVFLVAVAFRCSFNGCNLIAS